MKTIIIIPAYNESENIEAVIQDVTTNMPEADYVVINDCSKDNTLEVLRSSSHSYISLPSNLGIGGAMQTGYKYALQNGYDIAIQMDGDGQHDASYIQALVDPIVHDEADIVIGSRYIRNEGFQSSAMRRLGIRLLSMVIQIRCHVTIKDVTSGFRAANRKYIELWSGSYPIDYPEPESTAAALLRRGRVKEIPVVMRERQHGVSSINPMKSIYYMIKVSLAILLSGSGAG